MSPTTPPLSPLKGGLSAILMRSADCAAYLSMSRSTWPCLTPVLAAHHGLGAAGSRPRRSGRQRGGDQP